MPFARGDTFHYGVSNSTCHLHIVLCASTNPQEPIIAVSVNTVTPLTDTTLVLQINDHPYITRPSAVSYNRVDYFPVSVLMAADAANQMLPVGFRNFRYDVSVTPTLLQKITEGALSSKLTPPRMKAAIRQRLNLPLPVPPAP